MLAVILRLPNFNESLWLDEVWATRVMLKDPATFRVTVRHDPHPPFYSALMFVWIRIFGDTEISIRIVPLLFGIASIYLTYNVGSQFRSRRVGLFAAFLMCVSPVHIWYSQEARPYSAVVFFLLLSVLIFHKASNPKSNRHLELAYFVSLLAAVFTHYYALLFVGAFSLISVYQRRYRILLYNVIIVALLALFLIVTNKYSLLTLSLPHLRPFTPVEMWMLFFNWFTSGNSIWNVKTHFTAWSAVLNTPEMILVQLTFLIILARGIIRSMKTNDSSARQLPIYLFCIPLTLLGLYLIFEPRNYIERSMLPALPFFYIVLAIGAMEFRRRAYAVLCVAYITAFIVFSILLFYSKANEWTVHKPNLDWRSAARYFNREWESNHKRAMILVTSRSTTLLYYSNLFSEKGRKHSDAQTPIVIYQIRPGRRKQVYPILVADGVRSFYLLENTSWDSGFKELLESCMNDSRFEFQGSTLFRGINIYKFRRER